MVFEGTIVDTQSGEKLSVEYGSFSDDSKYASGDNGVYDIANKKKLFSTPSRGWFSHDSQYVAIYGDALYAVKTGKKRYTLPPGIVEFSPNSKYFGVWDNGIFETATGKQIILTMGTIPIFSPDSRYVEITGDGIYDLKTQTRIIKTTSSDYAAFSADSHLVAISNDGLYELPSAKHRFNIGGEQHIKPYFIMNSRFLVVSGDGVYDLDTNQKQYPLGLLSNISRSGSLIITRREGIIETVTGELNFRIEAGHLAANEKIILKTLPTDAGNRCLIFGIKGDKWPYRSGLVNTAHTQLYNAPDSEKTLDSKGNLLATNKQLAVFAQTTDKKWFRVSASSWVRASDVKPVSLPDGIPIENP